MAIVLRSVKGSNLTPAEVDGNFTDLDGRVTAIEENPVEPNEISNIFAVGTQMHVVMEDATEHVLTMPQANFRPSVTDTVEFATDGTYTPTLADTNGYLRCLEGGTIMIPSNAEVPFVVDAEITFRHAGSGPVVFDTPTDVVLNGIVGFLNETAFQGATVTIKKVATDEWDIMGLLAEDVTA